MRGDDYVIKDVNNLTGIDKLRIIGAGHERRGQTDAANAMYDIADQIAREHAEDCFKMGYLAAERIEELEREVKHQQDVGACKLERLSELVDENKGLRRRVENQRAALDGLTASIEEMRPRLMPEGYSWPAFEDGEPVKFGDVVSEVTVRSVVFREDGILLSDCTSVPGWGKWRSYKEPIKRPAKALDADGAEIHVGDTVYGFCGQQYEVTGLCEYEPSIVHAKMVGDGVAADELLAMSGQLNSAQLEASKLTHRVPVLEDDGDAEHARMTSGKEPR